jgi:tetratricopeptide (TPR) repeat protein
MVETLDKIRTAVERHGTPDQQIRFLHNRNLAGTLHDRFVPSEETISLSRTALALRQQSGNASSIAHGRFNLAFNLLCRGAIDAAEEQLQRVLEFGARTGDAWLETASLAYLTVANRKRGQVVEAKHYAERTLQSARSNKLDWYTAMAQANLAWVAWCDGDASSAQERARTALEIWKRLGAISPWQWTALWPLISLATARDDLPGAIDHASAVLDPEQQRLPQDLAVHLEGAVQGFEAGDKTAARNYLKQAIELAQDLGYL